MRILIVGAGAIGGYFGGRFLEAGLDVTFLVRPRRRAQLNATGLVVKSPMGDINAPAKTVLTEEISQPFDLVVVSCKAYDLPGAIDSFAPAVGKETMILPLLNGLRHHRPAGGTIRQRPCAGRALRGGDDRRRGRYRPPPQ